MSTDAIPNETERDRVIETVARFHRAVDYADWDLFRSVVTDDVAWLISISDGTSSLVHDFSGAQNIVEYLQKGLPFELRSFRSEGTLANVEEVFSGGTAEFDPALSGRHARELPLDLQSVDFTVRGS